MTSDRIFSAIAKHLEPKVKKAGGVFDESEDVARTLAILAMAPTGWRCILQWQREDATGTRGEMKVTFLVIVQQGNKALAALKTDDVHTLLKRWNQCAKWARAIRFTNPDVDKAPLTQGNAQWLVDHDFPTRQISGEFSIKFGAEAVDLESITIP